MKTKWMVILWPAFLVAVAGTAALFSMLDPADLRFVGPFELERKPGYALGFFFLWALTAASSAFTVFLERSAAEVNRCPLTPPERPAGCPKREGSGNA